MNQSKAAKWIAIAMMGLCLVVIFATTPAITTTIRAIAASLLVVNAVLLATLK